MARLQKVMTMFLLRRKKDSQLDGKNLIELPSKEVVLLRLEFSEEEREIYSMVTWLLSFLMSVRNLTMLYRLKLGVRLNSTDIFVLGLC